MLSRLTLRGQITAIAMLAALATGVAATPRAAAATVSPAPTPLQSAWDSVLAEPGISHALIGGEAYDVTTGRELAAVNPDWRLTPGSVTKLYASAAALADPGNRFALTTTVRQTTPGGPLYLVGGGDFFDGPFGLPRDDGGLATLAREVAAHVSSASAVIGDGSLFDGWTSGPGWDISEVGAAGDPSMSALTSDADQLNVVVRPGSRAGLPPAVSVDPGHPSLAPVAGYTLVDDAVTAAPGTDDTLFVRCLPDTDQIVLSGTVPLGSRRSANQVALGDPALFTAARFAADLTADGVTLAGAPTTGVTPAGAQTIASYTSPRSLSAYLRTQNGWSINEMAENLYRLEGVASAGNGSPAAAASAISGYLSAAGLASDRVQVDGSGLSPLDEMSAQQVVGLLAHVAHQPYFQTFEHSLIHIGHTRHCTFLCGYMDGTPADGTVWLKTGNLANQWNYAGYAHAENGDLIAFTLLFDGLNGNDPLGESVGPIDQMTEDTAAWPHEPSATTTHLPAHDVDGPLPAAVTATLPASAVQTVENAEAPGDVIAASVRDVQTGRLLAQANGANELQGGLLGRLATTATFLRDAGTLTLKGAEVERAGTLSGSTLDGSLVLSGNADPLISQSQLTSLAQSLAADGIRATSGPLEYVAGDGSPFGPEPEGAPDLPYSTPYEAVGAAYAPSASPLVVGEDQVTLTIQGATAGGPATVTVSPAGSPVQLSGSVQTVTSGGAAPTAVWNEGTGSYDLSGTIAPGQRVTLTVAPPDPALTAADWFAQALRAAGITVPGSPVALATDPHAAALVSGPAPAAAAEAQTALTDPSDVAPFGIYQQLGAKAGGDLADLIGPADQIIDPSGNAAYDYLTANSISRMLAEVHADAAETPLVSALGSGWEGRQPERTTLAGYAPGPGGQPVAYVVIINGQLFDPGEDLPSEYQPVIGP